ncbi:MAG: dTMP kinase [Longimicrobiales bacterium]
MSRSASGQGGSGRGVFLAIEGPEGAGKSTQVSLLERWLADRGHEPLVTREPGGTPVAEEVRRILLDSDRLSARTELLLMLASRSALVEERIRPALEAGRVVVTDRFHLSTLAYQGYGRALPFDDVVRMNRFATDGLEPDLTVLLDVEPDVGAARRTARVAGPDRIERAGDEFHRRVLGAYRELAERDARVERLDATPAAEVVHRGIVALLQDRFGETFGAGMG